MTEDRFEIIPHDLVLERNVSLAAKATYAYLRLLAFKAGADDNQEVDLPPSAEIAAGAGVTDNTIRKYMAELRATGWLEVARASRNRPQLYRICTAQYRKNRGTQYLKNQGTGTSKIEVHTSLTDVVDKTLAKGARKRNVAFDALAAVTGANPAISGGQIGTALKAIRAAVEPELVDLRRKFLAEEPSYDDVPQDWIDKWLAQRIERAAADYRRLRPEWELTPTALATHWLRIEGWKQGPAQPAFPCPRCTVVLPSRAKLREHLYNLHDEEAA